MQRGGLTSVTSFPHSLVPTLVHALIFSLVLPMLLTVPVAPAAAVPAAALLPGRACLAFARARSFSFCFHSRPLGLVCARLCSFMPLVVSVSDIKLVYTE